MNSRTPADDTRKRVAGVIGRRPHPGVSKAGERASTSPPDRVEYQVGPAEHRFAGCCPGRVTPGAGLDLESGTRLARISWASGRRYLESLERLLSRISAAWTCGWRCSSGRVRGSDVVVSAFHAELASALVPHGEVVGSEPGDFGSCSVELLAAGVHAQALGGRDAEGWRQRQPWIGDRHLAEKGAATSASSLVADGTEPDDVRAVHARMPMLLPRS